MKKKQIKVSAINIPIFSKTPFLSFSFDMKYTDFNWTRGIYPEKGVRYFSQLKQQKPVKYAAVFFSDAVSYPRAVYRLNLSNYGGHTSRRSGCTPCNACFWSAGPGCIRCSTFARGKPPRTPVFRTRCFEAYRPMQFKCSIFLIHLFCWAKARLNGSTFLESNFACFGEN